jgi:hypothetical protein
MSCNVPPCLLLFIMGTFLQTDKWREILVKSRKEHLRLSSPSDVLRLANGDKSKEV